MVFEVVFQLSLSKHVVVPFINDRLFFHVNFASFSVYVFEVFFVLKVQVPWHEHILFGELFLAHTLVALEILLERPHVYQPNPAYFQHPSHLVDRPVPDFFVRKMVNDRNRNKPVTHS